MVVARAQVVEWKEVTGGGGRMRELNSLPTSSNPGFTELPGDHTGILFTNRLSEASAAVNRILENGSGVALGDVDGDGRCDIYLCGLETPNALYLNKGNMVFEAAPDAGGASCLGLRSTGAVLADIDGDGDLDLLVNGIGTGTQAFLNDGKGHFTPFQAGRLVRHFGSTSMALADVDGDGDLDLYVTNYRTTTYRDSPPGLNPEVRMVDGKVVIDPPDRFIPVAPRGGSYEVVEKGERDFLYLNDGQGNFAPVSWTTGSFLDADGQPLKEVPMDWGLSVAFRDLNGDGLPDIYVCNDFFYFPDRIWINEGGRRFRAQARHAVRCGSMSSMGVDFADIDRDGRVDFFVSDMISRNHACRHRQRPEVMVDQVVNAIRDPESCPEVGHNTLFWNRGDGTWAEVSRMSGVEASEWSWGAVFLDVDLDGYEDLIVPTGNNRDVQDGDALHSLPRWRGQPTLAERIAAWRMFPPLLTPIEAFRNNRDRTFTESGAVWGFTRIGATTGMACADLDGDGDLDLVVNRMNGPATIYRNDSAAPRVAVRLKGLPPNTRGVGARIRVLGGPVEQTQEMMCGGRYLSSDDSIRVFAAGSVTNRLRIEVTWRGGSRTVVDPAAANRIYEVDEGAAKMGADVPAGTAPVTRNAWFLPRPTVLQHRDESRRYDDYERQPMLSRKLSTLGPGVTWLASGETPGDVTLVLGAGLGAPMTLISLGRGTGASVVTNESVPVPGGRSQTTIVPWIDPAGKRTMLAGVSSYEDLTAGLPSVYELDSGKWREVVSGLRGSVGPLAVCDVDGDGDLDLFVGGRVVPARYPEAPESRFYRNDSGRLVLDEANTKVLAQAGMVSGATFADLNGDGFCELILATEWGPVRIYANRGGRFEDATERLGTARWTGWWTGVKAADLDGDGRLDLVAGNWGRNTRFQARLEEPLRIYHGDFSGGGGCEILEAYRDDVLGAYAPWRDRDTLLKGLPFLAERVPTYRAMGSASVADLLGSAAASAAFSEARTLDSMIFWNRGDRFEAESLPFEAQMSPVFGISAADWDLDGRTDLFLAQNFFDVEAETARYDGGVGLVLRGEGGGRFVPLGSRESGIQLWGQQRGCAVGDYDGDGRPDLVVAQHLGATALFRNMTLRTGVRVILRGPPGNPDGLGSLMVMETDGVKGAAICVQGGSGYWSCDSPIPILARPAVAGRLHVTWPGGRKTVAEVTPDTAEVRVGFQP